MCFLKIYFKLMVDKSKVYENLKKFILIVVWDMIMWINVIWLIYMYIYSF